MIVCLISVDESCIQSQLSRLDVCLETKVKRFAASEWASINGANGIIQLFRKLKTPVFDKVNASGIEYTLFTTGVSVWNTLRRHKKQVLPYLL